LFKKKSYKKELRSRGVVEPFLAQKIRIVLTRSYVLRSSLAVLESHSWIQIKLLFALYNL
jgi:hypothetical protein